MRKFYVIMCVVVFILACTNVFAFDGKRNGLIIGGGMGGGFLSNNSKISHYTESVGVFLTKFKIGYAPSNTLEIYYMLEGLWSSGMKEHRLFGVSGVGVTKYLISETGLFVSGGIGFTAV